MPTSIHTPIVRLVALGLLYSSSITLPLRADCPLALRSYEDVESRGFVLEFDPPPARSDRPAQQIGVATVLHSARGRLLHFEVFSSPGYGQVSLVRDGDAHTAYFFAEDLSSTKTEVGSRLLFIDGLGLADQKTGELPGAREHPLGDTIWRLVGCKE